MHDRVPALAAVFWALNFRQTERQRDRSRETERQRDRETKRQRDRKTDRQRQTGAS